MPCCYILAIMKVRGPNVDLLLHLMSAFIETGTNEALPMTCCYILVVMKVRGPAVDLLLHLLDALIAYEKMRLCR